MGLLDCSGISFVPDLQVAKNWNEVSSSGQTHPEMSREKCVPEKFGRGGECIHHCRHISSLNRRSLPQLTSGQTGARVLLLLEEGTCSTCQALHLLSTAVEWPIEYAVAADAQTYAEVMT